MPLIITDNELKDIREGKVRIDDLYKAHEQQANPNSDRYLIKMLESQVTIMGQVDRLGKASNNTSKSVKIMFVAMSAIIVILGAIIVWQGGISCPA